MRGEAAHLTLYLSALFYQRDKGSVLQVLGKSNERVLKVTAATAAKSLQSCPTLCDPQTAAHQAPLFLGFSRQEYCSGVPLPSPMHESEK